MSPRLVGFLGIRRGVDIMAKPTYVKNKSPFKDEPRNRKVKFEKSSGCQDRNTTCATCGKNHYDKYLRCTRI